MGDKDKYSTNGHIIYAMVHPSVFNTDWNEMGHISKSNGVRERWIFIIKSLHWCATCQLLLVVLKSQVPNDLISKQNMGATPHKAIGVGSLTTIHRASKCLPQVVWYLQCIQKTSMYAWVRKKPKDCNSKWWTYNTVVTTTKKLRRALRTAITAWSRGYSRDRMPKTRTSWHAHKTHTPFGYARPGSHPPCNWGN